MLPPNFQKQHSKNIDIGEFIKKTHHIFMRRYGWIPLEEFKSIPMATFWNLWGEIAHEIEKENKPKKLK